MSVNENKLIKKEEVLELIPMSSASLYRLIKITPILKPIKIGRGSFWKKSVITNYIDGLE